MKYVLSGDKDPDRGFYGDDYSVIGFEEAELSWGQVLGWDYVGVKAQFFVVCVFIASVPLMSYGFNCKVGVVDFVYEVKNAQGGQSN